MDSKEAQINTSKSSILSSKIKDSETTTVTANVKTQATINKFPDTSSKVDEEQKQVVNLAKSNIQNPIPTFFPQKNKECLLSESKPSEMQEKQSILYQKLREYFDTDAVKSNDEIKKYSLTSIMNSYTEYKPQFEEIYRREGKVVVYKVSLNDGRKFVLKVLTIKSTNHTKLENVIREYYICRTFGNISKNVVKAIDLKQKSLESGATQRLEILFEFGGIDLSNLKGDLKSLEELMKIIYQLLSVLCIMEEVGIAHFDLKPLNIVYDRSNSLVKLIDFGAAISFFRSSQSILKFLGQNSDKFHAFTELYAPPEVIQLYKQNWPIEDKEKIIPQKVDVYCFGITFCELLLSTAHYDLQSCRDGKLESHIAFIKGIENTLMTMGQDQFLKIIKNCLSFKPEERPLFKELKQEFEIILKSIGNSDIIEKYIGITEKVDLRQIIVYFLELHEYESACYFARKCLNEAKIKDDLKATSDASILLGKALIGVGENKQAIECLKKVEEINESSCETLEFASVCATLGNAHLGLHEYETSIEYYTRSESIYEEMGDKKNVNLTTCYTNLGNAYFNQGNFDISIEFHEKAIGIIQEIYSEKSLELASSYTELGVVYKALGRYKIALEYYEKAIDIRKEIVGSDHPLLAQSIGNLGSIYLQLRKYDIALELENKALNIYIKYYGEDHPEVAASYSNISILYKEIGKYSIALDYLNKAMRIKEKIFGSESPIILSEYNNISLLYKSIKKYDIALEYGKKAECLFNNMHVEFYPHIPEIYNNLGVIYDAIEIYETALEYYFKAKNITLKMYSENHPLLAVIFNNIGRTYHSLGQFEKAIEFYNMSIALKTRIFGEDSAQIHMEYSNLGEAYQSLCKFHESLAYHMKALDTTIKLFGELHPNLPDIYSNIGSSYSALFQWDKSLEYYEKAYYIKKKLCSEDDPELNALCGSLGISYFMLGKIDRANEFFAKCKLDPKQVTAKTQRKSAECLNTFINLFKNNQMLKKT